ncbi:MAG: RecQ family ATP-dependent DNA helicase [Intrasporangium sp.]|uniref:RecQ family ATP-dependent DNA helicase n=1 Tax=Intrasporangium sp. TaxID=1925024 RepID=UPI003F80B608
MPVTTDLRERALTELHRLVGRPDADFRDGQLEAIEELVAGRRRVLVVQRTGWGKSAVYFVATGLRRAEGAGPTVIVSPLLALMRDQIAAAERAGIRAVTLNSTNADEWGAVSAALARGEVDVLLVSPERLNNPRFRDEQLPALARSCGLLVVDEAHCISDWGHDFRPDYRRIRDLLTSLPEETPVLATTATANARVVTDVVEQLGAGGRDVLTLRGPLARESLRLGVMPLGAPEQRLAWLIAHLGEMTGSGIVYALTVAAAEDVATALREAGHEVAAYTGRTEPAERIRLEEALRDNEIKALVATSALGMGFDKPDLGFVIHLGAPASPVAYYQQVGRAGRATARADVLLLPGAEDKDIWRYFASASMPRQDQADAVLRALADSPKPLSTVALESIVDIRRTRLELLLKVLDVDGAVQRVQGGWAATGAPWTYDAERYTRVSEAREREQRLMIDYERTTTCRMAFLQQCLDDESAAPCRRCDTCTGPWFDATLPDAALRVASERLERPGVVIEPRAQWPSGMDRLGVPRKGRIGPDVAMAPGRAVARLSDLGWGQRLRELLRGEDAEVPEPVVRACVAVLAGWDWAERPVAIVTVPARRRPMLVRSLAEQLGRLGRLPVLGELDLVDGGPTGEPGGNSAFRLAGVWGRHAVGRDLQGRLSGIPGPVLLVDDVADSRWTLTCAAEALREAGAPGVLPLTLAVEA